MRQDRSAGWLAKQAIENLRRGSEAKQRLIEQAVQDADEGAFVSQEAVHAWMDTWDTEAETAAPEPDVFLRRA